MADVVINFKVRDVSSGEMNKLQGEITRLKQAYGETAGAAETVGTQVVGLNQSLGKSSGVALDANRQIRDLQGNLSSVNQELADNRKRYSELIEDGASPAHASLQQLERTITSLISQSGLLRSEMRVLKDSVFSVEAPTLDVDSAARGLITTVDNLEGVISFIDTRFLSFHERGDALAEALRELPLRTHSGS